MTGRLRPLRRRSILRRLFTPFRLRTLIRRNEIAYTGLAAIVGLFSGLAVVGMQELIHMIGFWIFGKKAPVAGRFDA